jgi:hypothetical protein
MTRGQEADGDVGLDGDGDRMHVDKTDRNR